MPMDLRDNKQSQKKWKNRTLTSSLEFALTGIFTAFKEERNMKKHAVSALLAVIAGLVFKVSVIEWLFLLLSIFLVITFEIVNSAIENVVDLAAGAVLVISGFAALTGLIIFVPKIWFLLFH